MSTHRWDRAYYEGAVEGAEGEMALLLSKAHNLDSRVKQFRMAVEQIGEMQSELDHLAGLERYHNKHPFIESLLAGLLLNRFDPMAPHHVGALRELLGHPTDEELRQIIHTEKRDIAESGGK